MNKQVENKEKEFTTYGSIGIAVFSIFFGLVYLVPNTFPEGTLYIAAGGLIAIVTILNNLKGIAGNGLYTIFAIVFLMIGTNKLLTLEIKFLPIIFIVMGITVLLANIKKLR